MEFIPLVKYTFQKDTGIPLSHKIGNKIYCPVDMKGNFKVVCS